MELHELKQWLKQYQDSVNALKEAWDIEHLKTTVQTLEEATYANDFWSDHEAANRHIMKLKTSKQQLDQLDQLMRHEENLSLAVELFEMGEPLPSLDHEIKQAETTLETFEKATLLSEEFDDGNAIIEIHPGAGGTESQDWASMLYRMYRRFAEDKRYQITVDDYLDGIEAGLKSVTFTLSGAYAYGHLKAESGVHRLVRISPFDSGGRRHTSFASVNVIPEINEDIDIQIQEEDLKIDTYRSSGAGGQSVNTTDSAVRITHLPTQITVTCQNERSQIKNRSKAMQILKGRLYQLEKERQHETMSQMKNTGQNAFGSQIRSYVMHPYSMVKDHRTNAETSQVQKVLDGDLDDFILAYLRQQAKGSRDV